MATNQAKTPKRLSCISCRQRKIKCDRVDPCAPCLRAGIHCVFPQPAPPRARTKFKGKSDQIAHRLSRLEGLVNALGGEDAVAARAQGHDVPVGIAAQKALPNNIATAAPIPANIEDDIVKPEGGKYLGNDFWSNLSHEVEGLRAILNDATLDDDDDEDDDDMNTPPPIVDDHNSTPFTFPFGQGDAVTDLASRYPNPAHVPKMLELYFQRYDGVFKVLHRPSVLKKFAPIMNEGARFTPGSSDEALAFSLFYGAVTTLTSEECPMVLGADKELLLQQYERSAEVALTNAKLLTTTDLGTLQAFCIYILCRRAHYSDRSGWSLISLAVRIAFAIDLNCDGESLELSTFETEMRRRLWWGLVMLDIQGAEDRGMSQLIYGFSHDVKFPANINDEDIDPDRGFLRSERSGFTMMTFSMIVYEISRIYEYISCAEPKNTQSGRGYRVPTLEEKERKTNEVNNLLHERYVKQINPNVLLEKKASLIAQTSILKLWLLLQYPITSRGKAIMPRSLATKDQILSSAVSLLEIQYQLENVGQVNWISKVWIQWHPLAVVLAELCVRTSGSLVDRAWAIVDAVFDDWAEKVADTKHGTLWRPIRKLMEQARRVHGRGSLPRGKSFSVSPDPRGGAPGAYSSRSSSTGPQGAHYGPSPNSFNSIESPATGLGISRASSNGPPSHRGTSFTPSPQPSTALPYQARPNAITRFDPSVPTLSELHDSSIAMALDPHPQLQPVDHQFAAPAMPDMNNYMGAVPVNSGDVNSMMNLNWEDWDTFFQAHGLDDPAMQFPGNTGVRGF